MGMPDFAIFYTAGHILQTGQARSLYDYPTQVAVQKALTPGRLLQHSSILPYNHPPFESLLFLPLAKLSYLNAYRVWMGINVAFLLCISIFMRKYFPGLGRLSLGLWLIAPFAFFPIFMALLQGQDSILLLGCYCLAFAAIQSRADIRLGAALGFGLFKFHLVVPFLVTLAPAWNRKMMAAFVLVAAFLAAVGVWVCGVKEILLYPRFIWDVDHSTKYLWNGGFSNVANLRGLIGTLLSEGESRLFRYLLATGSALVLLAALAVWLKIRSCSLPGPLAVAVSLIATVLVSYHTFVYDWSILYLAVLLIAESIVSHDRFIEKVRMPVLMCVGFLLFSPSYMVLIFSYQKMEYMAALLVVLFCLLLSGIALSGSKLVAASSELDG